MAFDPATGQGCHQPHDDPNAILNSHQATAMCSSSCLSRMRAAAGATGPLCFPAVTINSVSRNGGLRHAGRRGDVRLRSVAGFVQQQPGCSGSTTWALWSYARVAPQRHAG